MEMTNQKQASAMGSTNGAGESKSIHPVAKEDVKSLLFGIACVMAALLIRYAIYLPQYMK